MRYIITIGLFFTQILNGVCQIQSIETEGNLEAPNPIECVSLENLSGIHNPADIYVGLEKCITNKDYQKAANLFALAGVYSTYDIFRVKDETAHQAFQVIQSRTFSKLTQIQKDSLTAYLHMELGDSERLKTNCRKIREIGQPTYHPTYMIQHGMAAIMDPEGNGLVEEFDDEKAWEKALNTFLHCDENE